MSAPRSDGVITQSPITRSPDRDGITTPPAGDAPNPRGTILWHPSAPGGPVEPSLSPLSLTVRPARLRDLARLVRVPVVLRLNQPEINLSPYRPAREALRGMLPFTRSRPRILVARAGDRLVAFAHWQPVLPDRRWQLIALGSATGVYDAEPVWEELARHSTIAAGLRGVKRLYARVPVGSPAAEPLRRLGFTAYASETVFLAQQVRSVPARLRMRPQEPADTWAIHQLYSACAPKQVQYAEAWTSHRWELRPSGQLGVTTAGWIVEDGHQVIAYARISSRDGAHVLELLYLPDHHSIVPDLLDGAIARLRAQTRISRIYCTLRGYQEEAVEALSERGFDPVLEQELYVKYTTVPARVAQPEAASFQVEAVERLPKRVPSFLHGRPGDGTASS